MAKNLQTNNIGGIDDNTLKRQEIAKLPTLKTKSQLNTIITNKDGTPDYLAINIYWDNLRSWYSPKEQHQSDGNVVQIKKLKTQGIYSQAKKLAEIHGASKETIRKKIVKLEKLGLVLRSFKHKFHVATNTFNQRIIYVLKETPYFFNPHGIDKEEIKEITPQTNAEYIEEKYSVVFTSKIKQTKTSRTRGGIHTLEDTKELREPFNKLKDRSNESNFLDNSSSSVLPPESVNFVETKNVVVAEEHNQSATIHNLKPNKPGMNTKSSNKRRKSTNAQNKAKKAKLLRFNQYDKPKTLAEHYPLSAEDCSVLQSKSGREFDLNAQNEILLAMLKKPKQQGHEFPSKASFMSYMAKTLVYEKREAVKINNTEFKIKANLMNEQLVERTTLAEREKFLNEIEQQAILHVSPENQLKAKLANTLAASKAYDLLSKLKQFNLLGDIMEIHLNSCIGFTEHESSVVLSQVQAIHGDVEAVEFIMQGTETELEAVNSNIQEQKYYDSEKSESLQPPQDIWGQVSKELIVKYGMDTYKNWFSKLTSTIDEINNTLELKASGSMVQDWVSSRYGDAIAEIVTAMGFELKGLR